MQGYRLRAFCAIKRHDISIHRLPTKPVPKSPNQTISSTKKRRRWSSSGPSRFSPTHNRLPPDSSAWPRSNSAKKALELARQKHQDNQRTKIDRALDALGDELGENPAARAAFLQMQSILYPAEHPEKPLDGAFQP